MQVTTGIAIAAIAFFVPLTSLAKLVNIGTLFAFVVVAAGVLVLRYTQPDLPRAFRTPLMPVLPVVSMLASIYLMLNLPAATWLRFIIWMASASSSTSPTASGTAGCGWRRTPAYARGGMPSGRAGASAAPTDARAAVASD